MTSDSDVENFESHEVGLHYEKTYGYLDFSKWLQLDDWSWSSGINYYTRSNGLNAVTLQTGLAVVF